MRHNGRPGLRRRLPNTCSAKQLTPTRNSFSEAGYNSPGIDNVVKRALKEMTSQIVSAIQTAFKGFTDHHNSDRVTTYGRLENGKSSVLQEAWHIRGGKPTLPPGIIMNLPHRQRKR